MAALDFPNGPTTGDKYPVTPVAGQPQYTWDGEKWTTVGAQVTNATPSSAVPLMDATPGLAGTSAAYSRGDHVHPTDTTRAAKSYVDVSMVGYDLAQTTTANQKAQARANLALTKRNYVINGAMQVSQENGSAAGTTTGYYPVDMFRCGFALTGAITARQQVGQVVRTRVTVTTPQASLSSGQYLQIVHTIEGLRATDLLAGTANAKTITIQFGVNAPAGTYCVSVSNTGNARTYVAEYVVAAGEANTDVMKSVTLTLDTTGTWTTDNTAGIVIQFALACGATYQTPAGAWTAGNFIASANQFNFMGTNGNIFDLFNVSLTEGAVAPPFQVPDYVSELALCQRYFELWHANNGGVILVGTGAALTTSLADHAFSFKAVKRATPTFTVSAASDFAIAYNGFQTVTTCTAVSGMYISMYAMNIRATATGTPLSAAMLTGLTANNTANAKLFVSARL